MLLLHLAGEVAHHLVHQLAHHIAHFVRRVGADQIVLGHAHVQQVVGIQLHRGLGREVDDDQPREAAIEQHKTADVGLEARLADALHHAGVVDLAVGGHVQDPGDGVAQADQQIFGAVDGGFIGEAHGVGRHLPGKTTTKLQRRQSIGDGAPRGQSAFRPGALSCGCWPCGSWAQNLRALDPGHTTLAPWARMGCSGLTTNRAGVSCLPYQKRGAPDGCCL